jgi:hypothetical protein
MDYSVEPLIGEELANSLLKYHPEIDSILELQELIEKYGIYICCDKNKDWEITEKQNERLIELLLKLCLSLAKKPMLQEYKFEYARRYGNPDWEICYGCSKRFTAYCKPRNCNPMDI